MALGLVLIKIVKFELKPGRNLLNLKPSFKKGRGKFSCFMWGLAKTNGRIIHSHMENMQQLCVVMSCPELGRIEAVLQNVCMKCSFTLYTLKLAMDDSPRLEHVRDCHGTTLVPSLAMLHGLTGWVAERASFSIVLSQLISEGLHTQHSPQQHSWC